MSTNLNHHSSTGSGLNNARNRTSDDKTASQPFFDHTSSKKAELATRWRDAPNRECWRHYALLSQAEARALLDYHHARKFKLLPLAVIKDGGERPILIAIGAPNLTAADARNYSSLLGVEITYEAIEETPLLQAIDAAYAAGEFPQLPGTPETTVSPLADAFSAPSALDNFTELESSPVPRLLQSIIVRAITLRASDIHLDPNIDSALVRMRVHGVLCEQGDIRIDLKTRDQLIRRLKVLAQVAPEQTRTPLDGAFQFRHGAIHTSIRLSTLPTPIGEKVVLRLHYESDTALHALESLNLESAQLELLRSHLTLECGALLCAGPTGSGKTTLLYAVIRELCSPERHIITLEDPVEQLIPGVTQVQTDLRSPEQIASILPAILRQDPDVILVGEIRERRTAEATLNSALTGHLVLSTIHAENARATLNRLAFLGIEKHLIVSTIRLIIAQKLIPTLCRHCKFPQPLTTRVQAMFHVPASYGVQSRGCRHCNYRGVLGQRAVYEMLPLGGVRHSLDPQALFEGYIPLSISIRDALLKCEISEATALAALPEPQKL